MKSTKKSFLMSALSVVLCIAMLLGTTYAWFTDSVTSGKNKIVAGNLDVELKYYTTNADAAQSVKDETDLFKVALWEPGVIAYNNFIVSNEGSLALKYAFNLNVFDKNTYNGKDLTEVIKVAVKEDGFTATGNPVTDRVAAQELTFTPLADFQKTGNLAVEGSDTYGIVLYWEPTANDNDYNVNNDGTTSDGQPLFVEFGVNLVATQDTVEEDSFDNQYDLLAELPVVAEAVVTPGLDTVITAKGEGGKTLAEANVPKEAQAELPEDTKKIVMTVEEAKTPSEVELQEGEEALNLDVKFFAVSSTGEKTQITDFGTQIVTVDLSAEIPDGYELKKVFHTHGGDAVEMTKVNTANVEDNQFYYDSSTKMLTIGSKTFSPFTFVITEESIASDGMLDFTQITLESKTAYMGTLKASKDVDLIGNGTSESPYQVSTAKELFKALQSTANTTNYIDLTKDISLGNWYPTYVQKNIVLNGNNHKLYDMKVLTSMGEGNKNWIGATYSGYYAGLIGFALGGKGFDASITMSDLTFENCVACPRGIYADPSAQTGNGWSIAAIIAGKAYGNMTFNNVQMNNCTVKTDTKSGLFCGNYNPQKGDYLVKLDGCAVNNSNIVGNYNFGYIIGLSTGNNVKGTCSFNNNTTSIGKLLSDWSYVLNASGQKVDTLEDNPVYAVIKSDTFWALYATCYTYQTTDINSIPFEEYRAGRTKIRIQVNELPPIGD